MAGRIALLAAAVAVLSGAAPKMASTAADDPAPIVFATDRAVNLYRSTLYSIRQDGKLRRLEIRPRLRVRRFALSPDRKRILFERFVNGARALFVANVAGTAARRLSPPTLEASLQRGAAFSPDGRRVAFTAFEPCYERTCATLEVYVVGIDGRGLRRVGPGTNPAWSADGRRLAFAAELGRTEAYSVFVMNERGALRRLGAGTAPVWAPRGDSLAFTPDSGFAVCVARATRGHPRCARGEPATSILWSPRGERLALSVGETRRLAVVDARRLKVRLVTRRSARPVAWSPWGRRLAYVLWGSGDNAQLYTRGVDGPSNVRRVTNEPPRTEFDHVRWHGGRIGYAAALGANDLELAVMSDRGTGLRLLTKNSVDERDPAWSPDRRRIAFSRDREHGFVASLHLIDRTGRNDRRLTAPGQWRDTSPAWSPDGREIAFVRSDRNRPVGTLTAVDVRTRTTRALVTNTPVSPGSVSWSPDGAWIVFTAWYSGPGGNLYVVRPDGTGLRRVFIHSEWASSPSWSPDGRSIAYIGKLNSPYERPWDVFTVWPDGSGPAHAAENAAAYGTSWSPDGHEVLFSRERRTEVGGLVMDLVVSRLYGRGERRLTYEDSANIGASWAR